MRNISFALTTPQFIDGSKDVTRRLGWLFAKPGMILCAVKKSQGLKPGEKIERLGYIELIDVRREMLGRMTADIYYGYRETAREGFPVPHRLADPFKFIQFFCDSHKDCTPQTEITRIEFKKVPKP